MGLGLFIQGVFWSFPLQKWKGYAASNLGVYLALALA